MTNLNCLGTTLSPTSQVSVQETNDDFMKSLPRTESELHNGIKRVLDLLRSRDSSNIQRNRRALEWIFEKTYDKISSEGVKTRAAGFIADLDNGARLMNDYLRYLWDYGLSKLEGEVFVCYITLYDACTRMSGRSLKLCTQFAEIGLVQIALFAAKNCKRNYKKSRVRLHLIPNNNTLNELHL